jgi:uncharacterized protein (TIGR00645 family)
VKDFERRIEGLILASRWVLVLIYLGLAVALLLYALNFIRKLAGIAVESFVMSESDLILAMLSLIDAALVAGLLVMVMISGYENFVSRFDDKDAGQHLSWLGKLDSGSLKIKVASSIVAISSIHLLQIFLNASSYAETEIFWATIMHVVFVVSALLLGVLDRVMAGSKKD